MATFVKVNSFVEAVAEKNLNLATDTLKVMLTNTVPSAGQTGSSELTEITAGGGYTAGGITLTQASSAQTGGTYKLVLNDAAWTGSGGGFGPFQYAVLYDSSATGANLIGYWNYGSSISILAGETLLVDCDPTNGVLQIA